MNTRLFFNSIISNSILLVLLFTGLTNKSYSQDFYDISTIQTIDITFQESNWDEILDTYKANDIGELLIGTAVVNGVQFDSVGVKYKGNSTYNENNAKNPLHIYLDEYINQDYDGYESIKLSNGKNDPSFVREVLSYEIARKYMDAPLSNYAKVTINGSYYGMFSSSEAINGDFTDRRLNSDNDNVRVKCNPESTFNGNGCSLEYLGTDSASYYDYYEVKSDYGWQDLIDLTNTIGNSPENIENILDIDRAIWMLAFNNVLVNLDSYTGPFRQNYYLIKDDNNRFMPIVWDMNECLGGFEMIETSSGPPAPSTVDDLIELDPFLRDGDATWPLLQVIYNNDRYKKMYIAHCKTILEENFENSWYEAKADSLQDIIASEVASDPNAFYTSTEFSSNIASTVTESGMPPQSTCGITELMDARVTFLQSQATYTYTQPTISNITQPALITPFSTVTITAEISNANYAYLGYRYSKDEIFTKIEMFDDGAHDDGAASDGLYGVSFIVDEANTHFYIYAENDDAGIFSPQRAEHEYYKISATPEIEINDDVVINELMASNSTTHADESGEYDDWVELYNNTGSDISLLGYYLSDDSIDVVKWAFPDTTILANDYLIVWTDNDENQQGLHTNFKLSASGEAVYLTNPSYRIVNYTEFSQQTTDMGYARVPNGTGSFVIQNATFSSNNDSVNSVDDINNSINFNIYPNPFNDEITIETDYYNNENITITNITGQIIYQNNIESNICRLNTSVWGKGMYFIKIGGTTKKIVKD